MVPPNHPFVHRVFHEVNHPFWGVKSPIFGSTPISGTPGLSSQVLGSAVNPVLREGNSDRRVARPVKAVRPELLGSFLEDHPRYRTLPETNIFAPENGWLEYYFPIGEAYFQGLR